MLTVTAVRLLPHFGQATGSVLPSLRPAMFSVPRDTLSSPLGTFTTHLRRLVERVRHHCKIRSREGRQAASDQVRDSAMQRRTAFTTSPGAIGLRSTQAGLRCRRGSRLSVRMMTGRWPLRDRGNLLTNRSAIDVRENEVEDDRIEGVAIENRQRLDAVSCFHGVIPVQRQRDGKQPPEIVVDFDEEDGASGFRHLPATSADACACGVASSGRGRFSSSAVDGGVAWSRRRT